MKYTGTINIVNKKEEAIIDIEGIIGLPEWWQWDNPEDKVSTYDKFKSKINEIKNISSKNITVNIRSIGGNVDDALLIHDTLVGLTSNVTTVCYGYTASAATIIAQAGNKRQISSNSLYLIHLASTYQWGNTLAMAETIKMLEKSDDRIASLYESRGGNEKEFYLEIMNRQNGNGEWLSPDETLNAKLVDEIVDITAVSNTDISLIQNFKYPDIPTNKIIANNQKNSIIENMKFKWNQTLNFINDFFNWKNGEDKEITIENLTALNNECQRLNDLVADLEGEKGTLSNSISEKETEITNLNQKVTNLEGELAKAKADPTKTEEVEDPDVIDTVESGNTASYEKDVANFKS